MLNEPLSTEDGAKQRWGESQEPAQSSPPPIARGLAIVRLQGGSLLRDVRTYIDTVGNERALRIGRVVSRRSEVRRSRHRPADQAESLLQGLTVDRSLEHKRSTDESGGPTSHPMDLPMIRMAVSTRSIVNRNRVGLLLGQHLGEADCSLLHRSAGECSADDPRLLTHTRISVAEPDYPGAAEDRGRMGQLALADLTEETSCMHGRGCQTSSASRGGHQDDAMSLGSQPRHGPTRIEGLVVRMSVEADDGVCHNVA
jgi:hypothetical protein